MIVYNVETGLIVAQIPREQNMLVFFDNYPSEFKDKLRTLDEDLDTRLLFEYMVKDSKLIRLSDSELVEVRDYKRLLCESERLEKLLLDSLIPKDEEIMVAKSTIEILELLGEVL